MQMKNLDIYKLIDSMRGTPEKPARPIIPRRHQVDGCPYCEQERANNNTFHPSHDPSRNCQSGKRPHCSCDTCF